MNWRSIRVRLTAWYMAVLAAGMLLLGAGTWFSLRQTLLADLQHALRERMTAAISFLRTQSDNDTLEAIREEAREYGAGLPGGNSLRLFGADGSLLAAYRVDASSKVPMLWRRETAEIRGQRYTLELGISLAGTQQTLTRLRNILLALIPLVLLLAGAGGWWLSGRALGPVEEMTVSAETVGMHDTAARLHVPQTGDELQHLGDAWNRMLERIHASVQKTIRFTMDAAHDLRTPVAVIQSTAEVALRRERGIADYKRALAAIEEQTQHLSALIDQLVWLARGDAGDRPFQFQPVELEDLVKESSATMSPLAGHRGVHLKTETDPRMRSNVQGDRSALRRLLLILVDNAIKFSPPDSTVTLRLLGDESAARIEVEDQGTGIAPQDMPYIFDRFYRADRARSRGGFGLGLAIAKAIVEAHHGTIAVAATSGRGTVIEVRLPLVLQGDALCR